MPKIYHNIENHLNAGLLKILDREWWSKNKRA